MHSILSQALCVGLLWLLACSAQPSPVTSATSETPAPAATPAPSEPAAQAPAQAPAQPESPLARLALGSCMRQNKPAPIWDAVLAYRPEVFLFLGDNVYADTRDPEEMRRTYEVLEGHAGFQRLRASSRLLAVWDDHDYGENDAGAEYPMKAQSQRIFCDFFGVPRDSRRRSQPGNYDAVTLGPPGRRVQFLLLDTRSFRSALTKNPLGKPAQRGPYIPSEDPQQTILGEGQWRWLEAQLREPAQWRLIASSIQFASTEHGWETWGQLPRERLRMLELLRRTRAGGVVILSGDRHKAELSRIPAGDEGLEYPLYDLTASSLNQPGAGALGEPNRHRILGPDQYTRENFGTLDFDWSGGQPALKLAIRDLRGEVVKSIRVALGELTPPAEAGAPGR